MIKEHRPCGGSTMLNPDLAKRIKAEAKRQERRAGGTPVPPDADDETPKAAPRAALTRARSVLNWGTR
jgi:hypothetical protein